MITKHLIATVTIGVALAVAGGALAAGEPKNDVPFTRSIPRQVDRMVYTMFEGVPAGESKGELPFTRRENDSTATRDLRAQVLQAAGEAKNNLPFTRPVGSSTVISTSNGFDWADAGIGAAAGLGLALTLIGGTLVARSGLRGMPTTAR
jgi:hypothetical protein